MAEKIPTNDLISIIVPCYNVEKYLKKCVKSLCNQTHKNIEIILVNDGSRDKTGYLCDMLAKKDPRIQVIHKENGGLPSARNYGIKASKGDYIAFIDADDWVERDMFKRMLSKSIECNVDIVSCGYVRQFLFIKKKKSIAPFETNVVFNNDNIINSMLIHLIDGKKDITMVLNNVVKLYRRNLIIDNNFLYNEEWFHGEDVEFIIRVLFKTQSIMFLDYAPYHYMKYLNFSTQTTRFYPTWFEQQIRYRKFIHSVILPLYGASYDNFEGWKVIIKYAHDNAKAICRNIPEKSKQIEYLLKIYNSKEYRYCIDKCNSYDLEEPYLSEITAVNNNDFTKWCTLTQN